MGDHIVRKRRAVGENTLKSHTITGGNGTKLHVAESGDPSGKPIVFIHGFSQCWLSWQRQMESELADRFRLVAVDLRGHGRSEKPVEGYDDSGLWADDINAVIEGLDLDHPVLSGWSYGPLVILDYLRRYGEDNVAGMNFVGGITKIGSDEAASVLTDDFISLIPGFFSDDASESSAALGSLVDLCFTKDISEAERYMMLGLNANVPPHVRRGLFSRSLDNDDLLGGLSKPALVTQGTEDSVVKADVVEKQFSLIGNLRVEMIDDAGHACFWDNAQEYNRVLAEFTEAA